LQNKDLIAKQRPFVSKQSFFGFIPAAGANAQIFPTLANPKAGSTAILAAKG
jgi:hypothetical protein